VRPHREPVCLIAQPLDEIEHRVARRQPKWVAPG
jgi:hypothetical protein